MSIRESKNQREQRVGPSVLYELAQDQRITNNKELTRYLIGKKNLKNAGEDSLSRREFMSTGICLATGLLASYAVHSKAAFGRDEKNHANPAAKLISVPKSGGAIAGMGETFAPDPFTGTEGISIPLPLSPGRDTFGPSYSLNYSIANGNGPFGLGWKLGIPDIYRKTQRGLPRYSVQDTFVFSTLGDLVQEADTQTQTSGDYLITSYRPRYEGTFSRIERWQRQGSSPALNGLADSFWRVTTKDNVTSIFGATANAVLANPRNTKKIFRWSVQLTFDGKGNYVHYVYKPEDGKNLRDVSGVVGSQIYLKRIRYGNLKPVDFDKLTILLDFLNGDWRSENCFFEAVFDYGEHGELVGKDNVITEDIYRESREWYSRTDPFSSYRQGFEVRTHRLCKRILMFHHIPGELHPMLVRSADFSFETLKHNQVTVLRSVIRRGYVRSSRSGQKHSEDYEADIGKGVRSSVYNIASIPPLEFDYSQFEQPDAKDLVTLQSEGVQPRLGLSDGNLALVDLFGRGLPDVLQTTRRGYYYWKNLGHGKLSGMKRLPIAPQDVILDDPGVGFAEITGDAFLDLLAMKGPFLGYCEGVVSPQGVGWKKFQYFPDRDPPFDIKNGNVRFVDLTGDGFSDALNTDLDRFKFYECHGKEGFKAAAEIPRVHDLTLFPDIYFKESNIHLADMTGDGLSDIVLIDALSQAIYYWPNLGFGHFGKRVRMKNTPQVTFQPDRMFFVDIDGSGPADLVWVRRGKIEFWLNRSGNEWGDVQTIRGTPDFSNQNPPELADMLGDGITGVVWSGPSKYQYLTLSGKKPGLLTGVNNNMGRRIQYEYVPSTELALEAEKVGKPWLSRLPFPVYVLSKVKRFDDVARTELVSEFSYAHGYYDEEEKEFRGFGRVEQQDTEYFNKDAQYTSGEEMIGPDLHQPPVLTKYWHHTGTDSPLDKISQQFVHEYYGGDSNARRLPDTVLPSDLSAEEKRDACRALKGRILRKEIYALDGSSRSPHPYSVSESNYRVRREQAAGRNAPAVFFVHDDQVLEYLYEREPDDPRVTHDFTLDVDQLGHITEAATVAYPRRDVRSRRPEQNRLLTTYTKRAFGKRTHERNGFRHGILTEEQTFELSGLSVQQGHLFGAEHLRQQFENAARINYEDEPTGGVVQKRLISSTKLIYLDDDARTVLPYGQVGLLALPHNTYEMALTSGLLSKVYGTRIEHDALGAEGGYFENDDALWPPSGYPEDDSALWVPSGHPKQGWHRFDADQFYLPVQTFDPFGRAFHTKYDDYSLLVEKTTDPLGNVAKATNDYRTLLPRQVEDFNGNRQEVAFDALGMVVGTAVMGKQTEKKGDSLNGFEPNLGGATLRRHIDDPLKAPGAILCKATSREVYDLWRYHRTKQATDEGERGEPVVICTLTRETHASDLVGDEQAKIQHSFVYLDGSGREIQTKVQAEPGEAPARDLWGNLKRDHNNNLVLEHVKARWVGTGRTVYDNKGNPVKQYEPFFSPTFRYEIESDLTDWGVTAVLRYDPLGRLIRTDNPDGSFSIVVFGPWHQTMWDANDTVTDVGNTDGTFVNKWYGQKSTGTPQEQDAANKALVHSGTPTKVHLDPLGRSFLSIEDNGRYGKYKTRNKLDIQDNITMVIDPRGNIALEHKYDLLNNPIYRLQMDSGERYMLLNAVGNPVKNWDSRNHLVETTYDELNRPLELWVTELVSTSVKKRLAERIVYGESVSNSEVNNLRRQVHKQYDGAGLVTYEKYDFKGNVLKSSQQVLKDYRTKVDWSLSSAQAFTNDSPFIYSAKFDALNRVKESTTPDKSRYIPTYNEANLLDKVDVCLRGSAVPTDFVLNIDYNAKGQRKKIKYGNGVITEYSYDSKTFRLTRLHTYKNGKDFQKFQYAYDPVGNITSTEDRATRTVYFQNAVVTPNREYTYDPLYRLIEAKGREHAGQAPNNDYEDLPYIPNIPHRNNSNALRRYIETFKYDESGNIKEVKHAANRGSWARGYEYRPQNDQLWKAINGRNSQPAFTYQHDAHGNHIDFPHIQSIEWDFKDQMVSVEKGSSGTKVYYLYDSRGQRVRKVIEKANGAILRERLYLGSYEIYQEFSNNSVELQRETLHVMDDKKRIAIVETLVKENSADVQDPLPRLRYQLSDHSETAVLELNEQAKVISYEEYYPYGETSYHSTSSSSQVSRKRYRYSGKEKDDETGLYYYGARYYAPWLGRWISCDPSGLVDGPNLYVYVGNNSINSADPSGRQGQSLGSEFMAGFGSQALDSLLENTKEALITTALGGPISSYAQARNSWNTISKVREAYKRGGTFEALNTFNPLYKVAVEGFESNEAAGRALSHAARGDTAAAAEEARESGRHFFEAAKAAVNLGMVCAGGVGAARSAGVPGTTSRPIGTTRNAHGLRSNKTGRFVKDPYRPKSKGQSKARSPEPINELKKRTLENKEGTYPKAWVEHFKREQAIKGNNPSKWTAPPGQQAAHPIGKPYRTHGDTGGPLRYQTARDNQIDKIRSMGQTPHKHVERPLPGGN